MFGTEDFGQALSQTRATLDACVVVGGHLFSLNFDYVVDAARRGVRLRILFPFPHSDWLAPMISAADANRMDYANRITTNAARARSLGSVAEVRWHRQPTSGWFTILDGAVVAHKAISMAAMAIPALTTDRAVLAYHQRLFDTFWASAERSQPTPTSDLAQSTRPASESRSVYLSFADEDQAHFDALLSHLAAPLKYRFITSHHRGLIPAGGVYRSEIARHLEQAQVILLLVSAQWLASSVCQDEFQQAIALATYGRARVVPILLRPCRFEDSPRLAELAPLPKNRTAVTLWPDHDHAWTHVVNEVIGLTELL